MKRTYSLLLFLFFALVSRGASSKEYELPTGKGPWCVVEKVEKKSVAEEIGIKPLDILLSINGKEIHTEKSLRNTFNSLETKLIEVNIVRGDTKLILKDSLKVNKLGITSVFIIRNRYLSTAEMKEDLDTLYYAINSIHPNPYARISRKKFNRSKNKLYEKIKDSLRVNDFWKLTTLTVAEIRDGHTWLKYPIGEWGYKALSGDSITFPLKLKFCKDKAYVAENFSNIRIETGSRLLSINNVPMEKMIKKLKEYVSGELYHFRLSVLERMFPQILHTVYQFEGPFNVEVELKDGEVRRFELKGINYYDYKTYSKTGINFNFNNLPEINAGILSFDCFWFEEKFDSLIEETFTEIKEKELNYLIIDIRENRGGASRIAEMLLNYLTDEPYRFFAGGKIKISRYTKERVNWIEDIKIDSVYTFESKPKAPPENPLRFKGKVYVLTSHCTFSTASGFAAVIKDYDIGTLVGEETGGLPSCYGDSYRLYLPNSKLGIFISWKYFIRPSGNPELINHGILPDIQVEMTPKIIQKGIDTVMEKVKNLIRKDLKESSNI